MSVKYFCDVCCDPLGGSPPRIRRKLGNVSVEIMVAYKGTWNDGHICDACVIKAATTGDPIERGLTSDD